MRELQAARGTAIDPQPSVPAPIEEPPPVRRRRFHAVFAAVMLIGLGLDVLTKLLIVAHVTPGEPVRWLGGLVTLRLIRNSGAAFSSGQKLTWLFATAAIVVLVYVIVRLVPRLNHLGWSVALGLLCAGVSGNLADRIFRSPGVLRGHVVDFIQIPFFGAIFNIADMCITAAAVLILVLSVIKNVAIDGRHYARPVKAATKPAPVDSERDG